MKKVLIITYYWPPSGGSGVQRWLKMSKYLSQKEVEVFVLTVDENYASFPDIDNSLMSDVIPEIKVFKTKATNYFKYYEKAVGKGNVPKAGYANVDSRKTINKIASSVRSHLFIPDPRKGWNKYAYSRAKEIIEEFKIDNVITTSPPHSTQLIGLKLKKKFDHLNWIADLRDPWVDIYYYNLLGHSSYSHSIDKAYEKDVLEKADVITTVSHGLKSIFLSKEEYLDIEEDRVKVITNGFDSVDFEGKKNIDNGQFIITYTGTMSEQYSPYVFFDAYKKIQDEFKDKCKLRFVGKLSAEISEYAEKLGVKYEFVSQVPHSEVVDYQLVSTLNLLVIPNVENSLGIITGKLFEYLASRNRILIIGPKKGEAAKFVAISKAGETFERDEENGIYNFIKNEMEKYYQTGKKDLSDFDIIKQFDRTNQAEQVKGLLK